MSFGDVCETLWNAYNILQALGFVFFLVYVAYTWHAETPEEARLEEEKLIYRS